MDWFLYDRKNSFPQILILNCSSGFSLCVSLKNSRPLWKHVFITRFLFFLQIVRIKGEQNIILYIQIAQTVIIQIIIMIIGDLKCMAVPWVRKDAKDYSE